MPTDTERRDVARRLRHAWVNVPDTNRVRHHLRVLYEVYEAVGIAGDKRDAIDLFDRLADLIEPTRNSSEPTRTCGECDRDALLALAGEVERRAEFSDVVPSVWLSVCADRIREACGGEA